MYIFGLNTHEVDDLWRSGYVARNYYHTSERLKRVIDRLYSPIGGESFAHIADYLIDGGGGVADPFMCLADFDSYFHAHSLAVRDHGDKDGWARKSLINTATSGIFASDNSVKNYADSIWHAQPINKIK
jgi:starch phosphorylase